MVASSGRQAALQPGKLREALEGVDAADFANLPLFSDAAGNVYKNNQMVTIPETNLSRRGLPMAAILVVALLAVTRTVSLAPAVGWPLAVRSSSCRYSPGGDPQSYSGMWLTFPLPTLPAIYLLAEVPHRVVFRRCL